MGTASLASRRRIPLAFSLLAAALLLASPAARTQEAQTPSTKIRAEETPRQTLDRLVNESLADLKNRLRILERLRLAEQKTLGALRWSYLLISPGPHAPAPSGISDLRLALALLALSLLLGPLHLLGIARSRLKRLPWAEESRFNPTALYRGPGSAHPLAQPLEIRPAGFGLGKEYRVFQGGRLAYRLLWPRTRSALVRLWMALAFLAGLCALPALSAAALGDIFLPALAALCVGGVSRFLFRGRGFRGMILNAQGKALAVLERSSMTTLREEVFVALDGERKPLAYFQRPRLGRWLRKQWWICPTQQEYAARVFEDSALKSFCRRLFGHLLLLRSSFLIQDGKRTLGRLKRRGWRERGRFELHIDRSPILPVIDPRAFLGLIALLSFLDPDRWLPSPRG